DLARSLEARDEVAEGLGRHERALVPVVRDERGGPGRRAVVDRDDESVAGEVPREVATHHGEACDTDLGGRGRHRVELLRRGGSARVGRSRLYLRRPGTRLDVDHVRWPTACL